MNDTLNLNQHISQQFNADLERLRTDFLEMGGLVEAQLLDSIRAIEEGDSDLAQQVIEKEAEVDQKEMAIDSECTQILARRQPAASDLRLVLMVNKAIRDLERMGDEIVKIARMAVELDDSDKTPRGYIELRHLATNVSKLVSVSLDAFARFDVNAAVQVVKDDKAIDREYKSAIRELITFMMEDPRSISRAMNVIWGLRALERVGDHARNIAEHIIYLVHGTDVRHTSAKELEEKIQNL